MNWKVITGWLLVIVSVFLFAVIVYDYHCGAWTSWPGTIAATDGCFFSAGIFMLYLGGKKVILT